jgi:pyridoxal/pyridoxine/pyridoxamine kinase
VLLLKPHDFVVAALPGTGDILALALFDHFLAQFLLEQVLEMAQTAVHVEVGRRVLL